MAEYFSPVIQKDSFSALGIVLPLLKKIPAE